MRANQMNARAAAPEHVRPETALDFERAVFDGLSRSPKSLPCRFFYDAAGSALFEQITRLPEYYPTRTETEILRACAPDIVEPIRDGGALIEFGSGSSLKTELLLRQLPVGVDYIPIDVSGAALALASARLAKHFPHLNIHSLVADFSRPVRLPIYLSSKPKIGFFPGSTIGNLAPEDAVTLLAQFRSMLGSGSRLIVGVDLKKDPSRLLRAYDDAAGVTASFNLNLIARINRDLGASIDIESFEHRAIYNSALGRIEMHLASTRDQDLLIGGRMFKIASRETIHTENSYKYTIGEFQELARSASWVPHAVWKDADALFSVHELR